MLNGEKPRHPLVTVTDFSKADTHGQSNIKLTSGFYAIMFKNGCNGALKYGRKYFDFQEGSLICISPNQVLSVEGDEEQRDKLEGWGLFFHPDLLHRTSLSGKMKTYTYFSYDVNEALHLSETEKHVLQDCVLKIDQELTHAIDKYSQTLIVSNIELLLNYCLRFYERQFITRSNENEDVLGKLESILAEYFQSDSLKEQGLPSVKYCADKIFLSPNYLSDLLRKETGKSAQEHIHYYLVKEIKDRLLNSKVSVNEIAYEMGFEYPHYLTRLFKSKTGVTPTGFRNVN
jgi:AraC-like DNA-binding protein